MKPLVRVRWLATGLMAVVCHAAFGGQTYARNIDVVETRGDGTVLVTALASWWAGGAGCDQSRYLVLLPTSSAYSEIYAMIMGAKLKGIQVSAVVTTCESIDGVTQPVIDTLQAR